MPIDYQTLVAPKTTVGSIRNYVNRSDIPVTNILLEAEAFIYERLRIREMMALEEFTVAAGSFKKAAPDGFLDPIMLTPYGWGDPLRYLPEHLFRPQREPDGARIPSDEPYSYTIIGSDVVFDVELSAAFGADFSFYRLLPALSTNAPTNALTVRYPTILRHACMSFGFEHMKDPQRSMEYRQKAEIEIADANATNELYRRGQN